MQAAADAGLARLRGEMAFRFGDLPGSISIDDIVFDDGHFAMSASQFVFTTPLGSRFHYRVGRGLVVQPAGEDEAARDDFELFLRGTVYGAVAWLNGFAPLHASAVSRDGQTIAFTGDSGAGKSTLAAALTRHGFLHVCDDTLVLDVQPGAVIALPDGKPLKLWDDALALTRLASERPILSMPGKVYAQTERRAAAGSALTDLVFLERGDEVALHPVSGAEKLSLLPDAFYRAFIHVARADSLLHARLLTAIASTVRFWRLVRPVDSERFEMDLLKISKVLAR